MLPEPLDDLFSIQILPEYHVTVKTPDSQGEVLHAWSVAWFVPACLGDNIGLQPVALNLTWFESQGPAMGNGVSPQTRLRTRHSAALIVFIGSERLARLIFRLVERDIIARL
jgi:hypothetical protein